MTKPIKRDETLIAAIRAAGLDLDEEWGKLVRLRAQWELERILSTPEDDKKENDQNDQS
jgi:hypothetical protein